MARKELARTFLRLHGNDPLHRNYYVQLGYQYGLTNQAIGDQLGITEAAVRQMLKRAVSK